MLHINPQGPPHPTSVYRVHAHLVYGRPWVAIFQGLNFDLCPTLFRLQAVSYFSF